MLGQTDLEARAFAAYYRESVQYRRQHGETYDIPSGASSGEEEVGGKRYVVLRSVRGVLKVYRVKPNGLLRSLKRWPAVLEEG